MARSGPIITAMKEILQQEDMLNVFPLRDSKGT